MLRFGFEVVGLHRIIARVDERNAPSVRLLRRLEMRLEARLVENEYFKTNGPTNSTSRCSNGSGTPTFQHR